MFSNPRLFSPARWLADVRRWSERFAAMTVERRRQTALDLAYAAREQGHIRQIVPQAFALVQTTAEQTIGLRHFDVQLLGGRALAHGHIIEMRTGEGKTLTAVLPLFVHALLGRGVLLGTVNDYLAKRDAEWMRPIYEALGLKVGVVQTEMERDQRRLAYQADVTYGTMKEFGFDFLRDRSLQRQLETAQLWYGQAAPAQRGSQDVHRKPYFFLIDEADSILIDEARTPMILSAAEDPNAQQRQRELYSWSAQVAPQFHEDEHYLYDKEKRKVELTTVGTAFLRQLSKSMALHGVGLVEMYEFVERAIQVHRDYLRDRDYVIREGEIMIVDEATGRISHGRRWSRGIHQAIEAKEQVKITMESRTQARITVQAFVNRFPLIAGMTGTAYASKSEFRRVYHTPVTVIPPNKSSRQQQWPTQVLPSEDEKFAAVVAEIREVHQQGRPVLVGTKSIAKSEKLSALLRNEGIEHVVLNANHIEREAEIVAQAGGPGRVTVATNMAGRGTDIQITDEVRELGGLHVIGTEMHESSRVDWQLFGRCGRQGDPGSIHQFLAHEDQLLEMAYGTAKAKRLRTTGKTRAVDWWIRVFRQAQLKVERRHFRARKLLMYNEKMTTKSQREMGLDPILDHLLD